MHQLQQWPGEPVCRIDASSRSSSGARCRGTSAARDVRGPGGPTGSSHGIGIAGSVVDDDDSADPFGMCSEACQQASKMVWLIAHWDHYRDAQRHRGARWAGMGDPCADQAPGQGLPGRIVADCDAGRPLLDEASPSIPKAQEA